MAGIDFSYEPDRDEAFQAAREVMHNYNQNRIPFGDRIRSFERSVVGATVVIGGITYLVGSAAYKRVMGKNSGYLRKQRGNYINSRNVGSGRIGVYEGETVNEAKHRERESKMAVRNASNAKAKRAHALRQARAQRNGFPYPDWVEPVAEDEETGGGGPVNYNEVSMEMGATGDVSQINTMAASSGASSSKTKTLSKEEKERHLGFSERAGQGLKAKASQIGSVAKRRKTNGFLLEYMEAAMLPFYRAKTYGSGILFGGHTTTNGVEAYTNPSDDLITWAYEGNRQAVLFGEFFTTDVIRKGVRNALGMRAQSVATNMLPMFGIGADDDIPTSVVNLDAEVSKDRFCMTNRLESLEWNITVNLTNMSLNLTNCDIYVYRCVDHHSTSFQVTQARESADYSARLAQANGSLIAEFDAAKVESSLGYTNMYWKPKVGKHTDKYWSQVSHRKIALGAVQTVSLTLNGPVGIIPLRKVFRNAGEEGDGIPGATTSTADELYCPWSYSVCIVCQGGEVAGDASVATNIGTCSGVITVSTDLGCKLRLLPNMESVKQLHLLPAQRPFILEANVRTISKNAITWKNADDVTG